MWHYNMSHQLSQIKELFTQLKSLNLTFTPFYESFGCYVLWVLLLQLCYFMSAYIYYIFKFHSSPSYRRKFPAYSFIKYDIHTTDIYSFQQHQFPDPDSSLFCSWSTGIFTMEYFRNLVRRYIYIFYFLFYFLHRYYNFFPLVIFSVSDDLSLK